MVYTNSVNLTTDISARIMSLEQEIKNLTEMMLMFSFGIYGHDTFANGESSTSGDYYATIQVLADTTFEYKEANSNGGVAISGDFLQGDVIYGTLYDIDVTTGSLRAYKRPLKNLPL